MSTFQFIDSNTFSIIFDPGQLYTIIIDQIYSFEVFNIPNSPLKIIRGYIEYDDEYNGWVELNKDKNDKFLALKSKSKEYIRWEKKLEKLDKKRYKHGGFCKSARIAGEKWLELKNNPPKD